jgi:hypothetical protein
MDNLGDWLYIVFIIVAAVSGLFSSAKKKKRTAAKPVHTPQHEQKHTDNSEEKSFWELLEEMQSESKPKQQKVKVRKTESAPTLKKTTPPPFLATEKNIPDNFTQKEQPVLLENDNIESAGISLEDLDLQHIEEVRKAIIYSEILHRKY